MASNLTDKQRSEMDKLSIALEEEAVELAKREEAVKGAEVLLHKAVEEFGRREESSKVTQREEAVKVAEARNVQAVKDLEARHAESVRVLKAKHDEALKALKLTAERQGKEAADLEARRLELIKQADALELKQQELSQQSDESKQSAKLTQREEALKVAEARHQQAIKDFEERHEDLKKQEADLENKSDALWSKQRALTVQSDDLDAKQRSLRQLADDLDATRRELGPQAVSQRKNAAELEKSKRLIKSIHETLGEKGRVLDLKAAALQNIAAADKLRDDAIKEAKLALRYCYEECLASKADILKRIKEVQDRERELQTRLVSFEFTGTKSAELVEKVGRLEFQVTNLNNERAVLQAALQDQQERCHSQLQRIGQLEGSLLVSTRGLRIEQERTNARGLQADREVRVQRDELQRHVRLLENEKLNLQQRLIDMGQQLAHYRSDENERYEAEHGDVLYHLDERNSFEDWFVRFNQRQRNVMQPLQAALLAPVVQPRPIRAAAIVDSSDDDE